MEIKSFRRGPGYLNHADLRQAGLALCQAGQIERGAAMLEQSGWILPAAEWLADSGDFENAHRLYLQAGSKRKAARMLEKMKRWADAEVLYRELGDQKRVEASRKKLAGIKARKAQEPLF